MSKDLMKLFSYSSGVIPTDGIIDLWPPLISAFDSSTSDRHLNLFFDKFSSVY